MYFKITSVENLLVSWQEFLKGKKKRRDVQDFSIDFIDNIYNLHKDLSDKTYRHGLYHFFKISDPKPRNIHKAPVRDRLLHHALHRVLYPYFNKTFIFDSYSCRTKKGLHRAIDRFRSFAGKASCNHTRTVWVLKGDIKNFFATIDHEILKKILKKHIHDEDVLWLLDQVIDSFHTVGRSGVGLPLGNLTSQLLINIYMNELDQFMKRELKLKYYIRYADDFVIIHQDRNFLSALIPQISKFLNERLKLLLHPNKVYIKTFHSGVDFLGWVHFPHHRILRTTTKRRVLRKIQETPLRETIASYSGLLSHGNTYKIIRSVQSVLLYSDRHIS